MKQMCRKYALLLAMLLSAMAASAQVKYCTDYEAFRNGQWSLLEADSVGMERRTASQKMWWGGSEIKFTTGNKAADKLLRDEAFVVVYEDSLYINCKRIESGGFSFGKGYLKALPFDGNKLLVVCPPVSAGGNVTSFAIMFGAIGAVAYAAASQKNWLENMACYLVNSGGTGKKTQAKHIDTQLMESLLYNDPELLADYKSVKKKKVREGAANTLDILERKGWIEK